jgi:hypothetical protein
MSYASREPRLTESDMSAARGAGWILFAAIVMATAGVMRIIDAFWAFDRDDTLQDVLLFKDNITAYGWLWLAVGILLVVAAGALLGGAQWARWFGIVMAMVAAISSMLWIYQYPIWSMVNALIAILVIYALTTYDPREL